MITRNLPGLPLDSTLSTGHLISSPPVRVHACEGKGSLQGRSPGLAQQTEWDQQGQRGHRGGKT